MSPAKRFSKKANSIAWVTIAVAAAVIAGVAMGWPDPARAAKSQPSPFAGCYGDGTFLVVTISESGRIAGDYVGIGISGRIWSDGYLELTYKWSTPIFDDPQHGGGRKKFSTSATGIAALDEEGSLYGVLQWNSGGFSDLFWPRCQ